VKQLLAYLFAGALFGAGLAVSGMTNPAKVLGFLDLTGAWDPSLLLVMGGGMGFAALGIRVVEQRNVPFFSGTFPTRSRAKVDLKLVLGSACFGAGWGLGGFCPGPAVTSLAHLDADVGFFVLAMLASLVTTFAGVIADPLQVLTGTHRRRLSRL
jgi:uncharacterized membrane protein YedE/YeeE